MQYILWANYIFSRYRKGIRDFSVSLSVCLLFTLLCVITAFAEENHYLTELKARAEEKKLYTTREWDVLLHYKKKLLGGTESLVDDPKFFLAPDGKKNPGAELNATLEGLFREDLKGDDKTACKFIARYHWLKSELDIDESRLPPFECKKFQEIIDKIKPRKVVLIFPTAHMNSPASMFGHTLIRVDTRYESKLVSYAVTYAANATDKNGVLYAIKGLFGFYHGYYSILPYYEKVREYNNMERRDIWEYELNFTEEEVMRMVEHIWELQDTFSYYYFFDENCSYELLFLFEAARPSIYLTDGLNLSVIPADTVKQVEDLGLVSAIHYRPSQATMIENLASKLNDDEKKLAIQIASKGLDPASISQSELPPETRATLLELAAELAQYRYAKRLMKKEDYQKQFISILAERGKLGDTGESAADSVPEPPKPEDGHASKRAAIGVGLRDDQLFMDFRIRPAYHNLLDPDDGYLSGSQIDFFDTNFRYYFEKDKLELERFSALSIVSLSPRDEFFQPHSWKVDTGVRRKMFSNGENDLVFYLNPGGGFAWKSRTLGLYYFMIESDLDAGGDLSPSYSLGLGGSIGLLSQPLKRLKTYLTAKGIGYFLGDNHDEIELKGAANYKVSRNHSLELSLSRIRSFGRYESQGVLDWKVFF